MSKNKSEDDTQKNNNSIIWRVWWALPVGLAVFWIVAMFTGGGQVGDYLIDLFGYYLAIITPILILALYFLPSYIAWRKKKRSFPSIFIINLFLGWTFLAWILLLAWGVHPD